MKAEMATATANEEGANSSSIQKRVIIIPRRSKRAPKGLCVTECVEVMVDQNGGGHNVDKAALKNNDTKGGEGSVDRVD